MPAPAKSWGYVYILRSLQRYKIGYTGNLRTMKRRITILSNLNAYGAEPVLILRSRRAHTLEVEIHRTFASVRVNGEWFELTPEDVECITQRYTKELFEIFPFKTPDPS
jgi:hypothetical protein